MSIKQVYSTLGGSGGRPLNQGVTEYTTILSSFGSTVTNEDLVTLYFRPNGGAFTNLSVYISANTLDVAGTWRLRVNKANVNNSVSITAATTGTFTDAVSSDTIAANDLINYLYTAGAGTGSATMQHAEIVFNPTTNYRVYAGLNAAGKTAAINYLYTDNANGSGQETDETIVQIKWRLAGTFKKLNCNVVTNTDVAARNLRLRVNAVNGNNVVSITALTTGFFEDTASTDVIVSGDAISFQIDQITAASTLLTAYHCVTFVPSSSTDSGSYGIGWDETSTGQTRFSGIGSSMFAVNLTEANIKTSVAFGWTASKLQVYVPINAASSAASTLDLRVNGVSSALTVSITAATTGEFSDLTNTVTGVSGDVLNYRIVNGGGGVLDTRARGMVMLETQAAAAVKIHPLMLMGVG